MAKAPIVPASRVAFSLRPGGQLNVRRLGFRRSLWSDLYHALLTRSWPIILGIVGVTYLAINAAFAGLFLAGGNAIAGARHGSFADAFFFSVQTFATIGYGVFSPATPYAHILVTADALVGILFSAMATGLMFAKFARPTARVLFSEVAVISAREGVPTLQFRMANGRTNQIVDAQVKVVLSKAGVTADGERFRRFHDMRLARDTSPILALTWSLFHPIDEGSPLRGETAESLAAAGAAIIVTLTGIDDTMGQTIHARHFYPNDQVRFGAKFLDILHTAEDGVLEVDYSKFHSTVAE